MEARQSGLLYGLGPARLSLESGAAQNRAFGSGEDEGVRVVRDVVAQVQAQVFPDGLGNGDRAAAGCALGWPEQDGAISKRRQRGSDGDGGQVSAEIGAVQCGE